MARTPWSLYFWPGLPHLWVRGGWSGLVMAFGFACLVNLMLLADLIWGEPLTPTMRNIGWGSIAIVWFLSALLGYWWERKNVAGRDPVEKDGIFDQALSNYLQGNWFEVECVLSDLLRKDVKDIEARLMLATLLRHTERFEEAKDQLDRLERFEEAYYWKFEIDREKEMWGQAVERNLKFGVDPDSSVEETSVVDPDEDEVVRVSRAG